MSVKNWHVGKLALLWAWGAVLVVLCLEILEDLENAFTGFLLIAAVIVLPVALSVVTWRWLGGKEK